MNLIAGIDVGTSAVKVVVTRPDGTVVARRSVSHRTVSGPVPGAVEQDPQDWWQATATALGDTGVAHQIAVLGIGGQMQDLVPVTDDAADRRPVRPALLYSDLRATEQHRRLLEALPDWTEETGNEQDASNVAAKIAWLADHEPDSLGNADHLLLSAGGYLAWRAGGDPACDVLTASTTGLLDVRTRRWADDVVAAAGADPGSLPRLVGQQAGDGLVGEVSEAAAAELGVRAGTPLVLGLGDAGAATDGLIGSEPGEAYLSLGTTGWLAAVTPADGGPPSPIHRLVMPGWKTRLRIGAVQSAGQTAAWALQNFLPGKGFAEADRLVSGRLEELAARPLCLPGLSGERAPVRDARFRGAFVGAGENTRAEDFYLAALTGVALALRHVADQLGIRQRRVGLVGGGGTSPVWRQICADVFDATIVTGSDTDATCWSAARSAAAASGLDHRLEPLLHRDEDVTETAPSRAATSYQRLVPVHRDLYDALAPTFHGLAG
ncbi:MULTISPECIES: FGGY family carbohydrate kinase [unclassified Luteococcus]|uniref:FGGY family carbohydrate kinase n=1 Tax=unclassified Luteococcus TaxID=2639923 RepID=UPI00313D99B9